MADMGPDVEVAQDADGDRFELLRGEKLPRRRIRDGVIAVIGTHAPWISLTGEAAVRVVLFLLGAMEQVNRKRGSGAHGGNGLDENVKRALEMARAGLHAPAELKTMAFGMLGASDAHEMRMTAPIAGSLDGGMMWRFLAERGLGRFSIGIEGGGAYQEEQKSTSPIEDFHAARLAAWIVHHLPPALLGMVESALHARRAEERATAEKSEANFHGCPECKDSNRSKGLDGAIVPCGSCAGGGT